MGDGAPAAIPARRDAGTACLALGVLAMFAWMLPAAGMAVPILGMVAGRGDRGDRARVGRALCVIGLGLGCLLLYWLTWLPPLDEF